MPPDWSYANFGLEPQLFFQFWMLREGTNSEVQVLLNAHDLDTDTWGLYSVGSAGKALIDDTWNANFQGYIDAGYNKDWKSLTGKYLLDADRLYGANSHFVQAIKDGALMWSQRWGQPGSQLPPQWSSKIIDFTAAVGDYSVCSAEYSCFSADALFDYPIPLITPRGKYIGQAMQEQWSMIAGPWPAGYSAPSNFGIYVLYAWSGY